jgi:phenylacetate-coenzyme A ligase PaaK-like adenylate-forming protein
VINNNQTIYDNLTARIFSLQKEDTVSFEKLALDVFKLQFNYNKTYNSFVNAIGVKPSDVTSLNKIPFLPIEFFKTQKIITEFAELNKPITFSSSGTTQTGTSYHYVNDVTLYEKSFTQCFNLFFGKPSDYCVLALLPSYLERTGSSLVYMAQKLIDESHHTKSGFYLDNYDDLIKTIGQLKQQKQKTLLLGVSYALLDLADKNISLPDNFIVMETGGMKGRRKEMLKEELHATLKEKLKIDTITSEYGMTELLSQAYSLQNGLFQNPPWLRILTRDTNDPFSFTSPNKTGGINVIDLANINSCSFIATQDLGKIHPNNTFELMGRFDNSDIRGCNLLIN